MSSLPGADYVKYLALAPLLAAGGSRVGQQGLLGLMNAGQAVGPSVQRRLTAVAPMWGAGNQ